MAGVASAEDLKIGHTNRIIDEIVAYLDEYFDESGTQRPADIESYIQKQCDKVLNGLYGENDPEDEHVSTMDSDVVEGDYYREAIAEYSTVFADYTMDE
jgi:hypothetical protein